MDTLNARISRLKDQVIAANHLEPWLKRIALDALYNWVDAHTREIISGLTLDQLAKCELARLINGAPGFLPDILWEALPIIEEMCYVYPDPEPQPKIAD